MKKTAKRIVNAIAVFALSFALGMFAAACGEKEEPDPGPVPPVKVSDGYDFEIAVGKSKNITVADHITANNNAVTASSSTDNATATVADGLLTVTGAAVGDAVVTLTCEDISVTFDVSVFMEYTVTLDGTVTYVRAGETYTLPAPVVTDPNMEFDYYEVGTEHKAPSDTVTVNENIVITTVTKRKAAVKVKDGEPITAKVGIVVKLDLADYITAYGATVTAESDDGDTVEASIADGKIVITPKAEGSATVTVVCGEIEIEFGVTVEPAPAVEYTVTVDGEEVATVVEGGTFVLPQAVPSPDPDFEFVGWDVNGEVKQPGETIVVETDLNITRKLERKAAEKVADGITVNLSVDGSTYMEINVADYIVTHGNAVSASSSDGGVATATVAAGKLTITAVAVGNITVTLSCGDVDIEFTVNVSSAADGAPVFNNGTISFDLFEKSSGTYDFEMTAASGSDFTYSYTVTPDTGVSISGDSLTYTATAAVSGLVLTVNVTAVDPVLGTKTASFTVTVNVTDTTPSAKKSEVTATTVADLYNGACKIDLSSNINNAQNVSSYKVNGGAVTGSVYTVTGSFDEEPTDVSLSIEAVIDGTRSVTYTYKLKVRDSSAYRIKNGGFDNGLDDWTKIGNIGNVSSATAYWTNENNGGGYPYNADGKFFSAYEPEDKFEQNIGALVSSTFKVSQSRVITFKLGGAKHDVFVDVVDAQGGTILARYGNSAWAETTAGLKSGCTLIAYKAVLPESAAGKTVYIRVIDMAASDYGVLFCDSFETYYESAPIDGFIDAVDITERPATVYDIYNGGFENDMAGWFVSGGDIGAVTSDDKYWHNGDPANNGVEYGKTGSKLFSWWSWVGEPNPGHEINREGNMGTLTSNMFVLKAGKFVSFKMGGGGNRNVYIELVNAESGTVVAVFRNDNIEDGKLKSYSYKNTLTDDALCYFRVVDNAVAGWGCFAVDDFNVNLDSAPAGSATATDHRSEYASMVNGSFETGNLDGWTTGGESLGAVTDTEKAEGWYQTNEGVKDGNYLFTFYFDNGSEYVNVEGNRGVVRSGAFILEKNGIVSFRFGAAHNSEVYIVLYSASGKPLATFRNNAYTADTVMVHYYYQADNAEETSCYFEVVDNATGDYGCVVMDDFRVNLDAAPEGAVLGSALTKAERDSL